MLLKTSPLREGGPATTDENKANYISFKFRMTACTPVLELQRNKLPPLECYIHTRSTFSRCDGVIRLVEHPFRQARGVKVNGKYYRDVRVIVIDAEYSPAVLQVVDWRQGQHIVEASCDIGGHCTVE